MYRKIQLLLGLLLLQCSGALSQTILQGSFAHDGVERTYRTYIPDMYDGTEAVPLVLNLHGYGSNSFEQMLYGDFSAIADTANFIVVIPDGTQDDQLNQFWNSFGLAGVDDVGFLSALIDTIQATYNIDANCVYSTGMSNGGFMSYALACYMSSRIAAIASVTGSMILGQQMTCNAQHPTPVMQIHGTEDSTVPYEGAAGMEPIDEVVDYWVEYNNCDPIPTITDVPNTNTSDNCTAEHHVYAGGDNESTVELYKVIGGGHSWPGALININTTNMDFSASKEIWRFFRQYKLDLLSGVPEESDLDSWSLQVYPNPSGEAFNLQLTHAAWRTVTITNACGQVVQQFESSQSQSTFELPHAGIYVVSVADGNGLMTKRIVKE